MHNIGSWKKEKKKLSSRLSGHTAAALYTVVHTTLLLLLYRLVGYICWLSICRLAPCFFFFFFPFLEGCTHGITVAFILLPCMSCVGRLVRKRIDKRTHTHRWVESSCITAVGFETKRESNQQQSYSYIASNLKRFPFIFFFAQNFQLKSEIRASFVLSRIWTGLGDCNFFWWWFCLTLVVFMWIFEWENKKFLKRLSFIFLWGKLWRKGRCRWWLPNKPKENGRLGSN